MSNALAPMNPAPSPLVPERFANPLKQIQGVLAQPAVRRAMSTTRNGKIGVIGTEGTIKSGAYQDLFAVNPNVEAVAAACPDFVPFVERGCCLRANSAVWRKAAR